MPNCRMAIIISNYSLIDNERITILKELVNESDIAIPLLSLIGVSQELYNYLSSYFLNTLMDLLFS